MILEHALLDVRPEQVESFERAFSQARPIIERQRGFVSLRLDRSLDNPARYLLLVEWERLEDHTEGFRGSADYATWRTLLHHFYEPMPHVSYFEPVR